MPAGSPHYEVLLTRGADQDLESIHDYIAEFDSPANAECVLDELMKVAQRLAEFPERGSHPMRQHALTALGGQSLALPRR